MRPEPTLAEIRALEERLHQPSVRRSREAVEALLAEGFVEFGASGRVYDRAEIIELLVSEAEEDDGDLTSSDYSLRPVSPDVVLLTYRTRRILGGNVRLCLRSSIWTHDGSRWKMLFHQGTVVPA
jgi:hypothetical protein